MKADWKGMWEKFRTKIESKKRHYSHYQIIDMLKQIEGDELRRIEAEDEK